MLQISDASQVIRLLPLEVLKLTVTSSSKRVRLDGLAGLDSCPRTADALIGWVRVKPVSSAVIDGLVRLIVEEQISNLADGREICLPSFVRSELLQGSGHTYQLQKHHFTDVLWQASQLLVRSSVRWGGMGECLMMVDQTFEDSISVDLLPDPDGRLYQLTSLCDSQPGFPSGWRLRGRVVVWPTRAVGNLAVLVRLVQVVDKLSGGAQCRI